MRRIVLTLIALCLLAVVSAGCGDSSGSEDPQQVLDSATFQGIESADFEASLKVQSEGSQGKDLDIHLSGRARAKSIAVTTTVAGTSAGKPVDFEGGLTLLDDHGFVDYQGTDYEIDPSNYSFAKPLFFPALAEEGGEGVADIAACLRTSGVKAGDLVDGLHNDGTVDVAGNETTKVSGELDVPATAEAMVKLAGRPGCRFQVEALSPFPLYKLRLIGDELSAAAKKAKVEIYVGDDDVVRKVSAEFTGDPKGDSAATKVDFEFSLSEINANKRIEVPSGAKPVGVLFAKLGIDPFEFLGWGTGGEGVRSIGEKVAADAFP